MAKVRLLGTLIVLLGLAAYSNSFTGTFVFDDVPSIVENPTIRDLSRIGTVLSPPEDGRTVQGRPVFNLSLALNYAVHGPSPKGYHVVNWAIHVLCALLLFGVVRRTLLLGGIPESLSRGATGCAFVTAAVWVLHPLCTAAVTYVIQRCEALMSMFYLLSLYCLIRGAEGGAVWRAGAVASCALGMATKETMVTAPAVLLLFDRVFLAGSFRKALAARWGTYAGLVATWSILAWLMLRAGSRGETIGYQGHITWQAYALTQAVAILTYLRLAIVPHPLVFDYGDKAVTDPWTVWPCVAVLAALLVGSLLLLRRRPRAGFPAVAFFLLLAPSSSVIPVVTQSMGEHRAYLPLAAFLAFALAVVGPRMMRPSAAAGPPWSRGCLVALLLGTLGLLTHARNRVYGSELSVWQDTVAKRPRNARAHSNLGANLVVLGRPAEALPHFQDALRLEPDLVEALNNLGSCLNRLGRPAEAMTHLKEALRLEPHHAQSHRNLGDSLADLNRLPEAIEHYREAIRLRPDWAKPHLSLGIALDRSGRSSEAIEEFQEAVRLDADYVLAHYNLGECLYGAGRYEEAAGAYGEAVRLEPDFAEAHRRMGDALNAAGRPDEAVRRFDEAIRRVPSNGRAWRGRAVSNFLLGRYDRAWEDVRAAEARGVEIDPRFLRDLSEASGPR